ncbi:uncharacterized protein [Bemisia tabaci]|uniref:uncharacterized protein n=1 Tax=Bemisia tabaci TaxID=7038 RepID=UPI003B27ED13
MEIPLQPYKDAVEKTSKMINITMQESWATTNPDKLAEHVQLEMESFILQLQNLRDEINELSTESLIREKRNFAPFGFIGSSFHYLFGLSTDEETSKLNNKLLNLKAVTSENHHDIEQQISILGDIHNFEEKSKNIIQDIAKATEHIDEKFEKVANTYINETNFKFIMVSKYFDVSFFLKEIQFSILQIKDNIFKLKIALQSAAHGTLTEFLMSKRKLLSVLSKIQAHLPPQYSLIFPIRSTQISKFYNLISCHAILIDNKIRIFLNIPLKTENRVFDLYKLAPLPHNVKNVSVSIYIDPPHPYVAISKNKETYLPLDEEEINKCHNKAIMICPANIPIRSFKPKTCIFSLIRNMSSDIINYCDRIVTTRNRAPLFYKPQLDNIWIYSVANPVTAILQCPEDGEKVGKQVELVGNNYTNIPPKCSLSADTFRIDASEIFNSIENSETTSFFTPTIKNLISQKDSILLHNLTKDPTFAKKFQDLVKNSEELQKAIPDGVKLQALKYNMQTFFDTQKYKPETPNHHYIVYVTIFILVIAIIALLAQVHTIRRNLPEDRIRYINNEIYMDTSEDA